jgi:hypothetical protein
MPRSYSGDLRERIIEAVEVEGRVATRGGRAFRHQCKFGSQMAAAPGREPSAVVELQRDNLTSCPAIVALPQLFALHAPQLLRCRNC